MTHQTWHVDEKATAWRRLTKCLKAFDASLEFDPVGHSLAAADHKVEQLEARIHQFESRLAGNSAKHQ